MMFRPGIRVLRGYRLAYRYHQSLLFMLLAELSVCVYNMLSKYTICLYMYVYRLFKYIVKKKQEVKFISDYNIVINYILLMDPN